MVGHVEDFFDLPKIFIIGTLFCIFSGSIDSYVILMGRNYTAHCIDANINTGVKLKFN